MHRSSYRLFSILILLAACTTTLPLEDAAEVDTSNVIGVAAVGHGEISLQALVPGLVFSRVDQVMIDGDGVRIQEVIYEIENTSAGELRNLTLYALDTPNTLAETNVSDLRDASGELITNPDMAPSIVFVHGQSDGGADMQAFTEQDKVRVKALLDETYPNNRFAVLSRGFVASNITGQGNRAIAAGEKGVVTIALRYPYDPADPAGYPASFNLTFAFIDEAVTRVTQGADESNEAFLDRLTSTFDPLPENLDVVVTDPTNPPAFDTLETTVTILESDPPNPPIAAAPITGELAAQFTLAFIGASATDASAPADADITVTISPQVQNSVRVQ